MPPDYTLTTTVRRWACREAAGRMLREYQLTRATLPTHLAAFDPRTNIAQHTTRGEG